MIATQRAHIRALNEIIEKLEQDLIDAKRTDVPPPEHVGATPFISAREYLMQRDINSDQVSAKDLGFKALDTFREFYPGTSPMREPGNGPYLYPTNVLDAAIKKMLADPRLAKLGEMFE